MSNDYTNISDLPEQTTLTGTAWVPVENDSKEGSKFDLNSIKGSGTLNTTATASQATNANESLSGSIKLHKVAKTGSYSDLLNKPTITNPGRLNTRNTTAQAVDGNESLSGTVQLHRIAKTGSYNDLLNKPNIPTSYNELSNTPTTTLEFIGEEAYTSRSPSDTDDWPDGEPLEINIYLYDLGETSYARLYGNSTRCHIVDFSDNCLLVQNHKTGGEPYEMHFDSNTPVIINLLLDTDFTAQPDPNYSNTNIYSGDYKVHDVFIRIVGQSDTQYDHIHPLIVKAVFSDEGQEARILPCYNVNGNPTIDISKHGYIRITGCIDYEIHQ